MRFSSLTVDGFRGFGASHSFDLDASAIVICGANGQGKTSLFDAILWGLTGLMPRLGEEPRVVSLYSQSGEARVELELCSAQAGPLRVLRREPGGLSVEHDGHRYDGDLAAPKLHEVLWPGAASAADGNLALAGALTRSVYLQQDLVRDFVEGDDQERFRAVSELAGTGRVTELSLALKKAKIAWSKATNVKARELEEVRERLELRSVQLSALGSFEVANQEARHQRWSEWWEAAAALGLAAESAPALGEERSANALDEALRGLEAKRRAIERRATLARSLQEDLAEQPLEEPADMPRLRERVGQIAGQVSAAQGALKEAERLAAEQRRKTVQRREAAAELSTIAELALRHIDGPCPVCEQEHDQAHTRAHLQQLIELAGAPVADPAPEGSISTLADDLERLESEHSVAQAALRTAESLEREVAASRVEREGRLKELGLEPGEAAGQALGALLAEAIRQRDRIDAHEAEGERLSVEIARAAEQARHHELQSTIAADRAEVEKLEKLVGARRRTGELAGKTLEALRDASSEVVAAQLEGVAPLLQRVYSTTDPHPCFRVVRLLTRFSRGRGRLSAALDDSLATVSIEEPEAILSSSQLNALAVSLFLTLNLGLPSVPMPVAILDDPLQSLDDVNLLGLIDLLRRTKGQRQLLVSTHDRRFADLLARKLRPVKEGQRTRVIELDSWGRQGPSIRESDFEPDPEPLRIAV